jgi:hypothetical protein
MKLSGDSTCLKEASKPDRYIEAVHRFIALNISVIVGAVGRPCANAAQDR